MEKTRSGYHGRVSVLTQQEIEASKTALRAETGIERSVPKEQYWWIKFCDVTPDDINAVLRIAQQITGKDVTQIGEEDLEKFQKIFLSLRGLVEIDVATGEVINNGRTNGAILEGRRYLAPEGFYARFTLSGISASNRMYAQAQIDEYFIKKGTARTLSKFIN